jgi:hypothetical protein
MRSLLLGSVAAAALSLAVEQAYSADEGRS